MNAAETRFLDVAGSEIRADTEGESRVVRGVALRYGSLSNPLRDSKGRPFRERFTPGAFSRALATGADVRALINHDRNLVMGRSKAGTLRLFDEADALRFAIDMPRTALGDHYRETVRIKNMDGVSFRFYKIKDTWDGAGDATVRTVEEADIDDVSIVTYPAYPDTEAVTRSLDEHVAATMKHRWDARMARARARLRLAEAFR